mmetsp:Transcript_21790/g.38830  ORF Transcript_21790/g.38830 Transcript_21790/m.38830 type:complete len:237 (-) Transcript_21790:75-785(-)
MSSSRASEVSLRVLDAGRVSHYYVGVGSQDAKLITLVELLHAFEEKSTFGVALCCRSRDVLDTVLGGLLQGGFDTSSVFCLHSDMGEHERRVVLQGFKAALDTSAADTPGSPPLGDVWEMDGIMIECPRASSFSGRLPLGAKIIAVTDVCLKTSQKDLHAAGVRLLVNYDMPTRKELYHHRLACLLGAKGQRGGRGGSAIHMVVAGEVGEFRSIETYTPNAIMQVPVRISDILDAD